MRWFGVIPKAVTTCVAFALTVVAVLLAILSVVVTVLLQVTCGVATVCVEYGLSKNARS